MTVEQEKDLQKVIEDLEKKSTTLDEWVAKTAEEFRVRDSVKCIECGKEKSSKEFQKVFNRRAGEGICKKCFFYTEEEGA